MYAPLIAGQKLFDQVEQHSMPWQPRPYQSKLLQTSVVENLPDAVDAFRNFAITRVGRHAQRLAIGTVGVGVYLATDIKWIRYSIKGVAKFAPVIGWGLLAYDLYNLGEDLDLY